MTPMTLTSLSNSDRRDDLVRGFTVLAADPEPEPELDWLDGIASFRDSPPGF
jgi:hypothetical protein